MTFFYIFIKLLLNIIFNINSLLIQYHLNADQCCVPSSMRWCQGNEMAEKRLQGMIEEAYSMHAAFALLGLSP